MNNQKEIIETTILGTVISLIIAIIIGIPFLYIVGYEDYIPFIIIFTPIMGATLGFLTEIIRLYA